MIRLFGRYWFRKIMTEPVPPVGCRLVRASGEVVPLDLVYSGVIAGEHTWVPARPFTFNPGRDRIEIDELPPRTSITLQWPNDPTRS